MNYTFLEESSAGTREISLESKLFTERRLFIDGKITAETASEFRKAFMYLTQSPELIHIYIDSPGGEVNAGLVIYDLIQGCKNEIRLYCTGMAFSMAAVILAGGQAGRRFILPHSQVMVHEAMLGGEFGGTAMTIRNIAEHLTDTQKQFNDILSKHTGRTLDEIMKDVSFDNYMSAEKAVSLGFCDKIVNNLQEV